MRQSSRLQGLLIGNIKESYIALSNCVCQINGIRCYRSDWPGLFCCSQPSCVVNQQSWFWALFFVHYFPFLSPTSQDLPNVNDIHIKIDMTLFADKLLNHGEVGGGGGGGASARYYNSISLIGVMVWTASARYILVFFFFIYHIKSVEPHSLQSIILEAYFFCKLSLFAPLINFLSCFKPHPSCLFCHVSV